MDQDTWLNLALVVVFVLIGGVFAATEIALVSLRESQLRQLEKRSARGAKVASLARDPNRFLAAVQIGVTVAGFFSAAYGASTIAPDIAPLFESVGLPPAVASTVALVVMTLVIAYLSLVLGELVPKRLALQRAEGFAVVAAPVLDGFAVAMRPVIWVLSKSTNGLVRLLGGDPQARSENMSEEELRDLVAEHETLDDEARRIVADVFDAGTRTLRESMRPRHEVSFLPGDISIREASDRALDEGHTRYPVVGDSIDDILGFVHMRDLLRRHPDAEPDAPLRAITRDVLVLPATNSLLTTLPAMRRDGAQIAIVVDEYGGTAGIVTLEDLVEDVIGQIRDEYDDEEFPLADGDGGPLEIDGGLVIQDFAASSGIEIVDGDYETVAGFIQSTLQRIPAVGDRVALESGTLEVVRMEGYRVDRIRFTPDRESDSRAEAAGSGGI
ncbi:hypothetical protein DDQ50_03095 [Amnibacterium flavum]|uniref:HlyC/CorC family transporter n=1 Tax=Amnibacterium flavum TaxID=2173173 RepID=A0A2V1HZQ3_9MICO|nr:hemolysin family protein [Amnibacterium flavum]PVZ96324.1 hypothetical protein DDQ50_03095 [Amnibacterium flavum]